MDVLRESAASLTVMFALALLGVGASACGDDSSSPLVDGGPLADGAAPDGSGDLMLPFDIASPAAPTPPAPPALTPCPMGWREIDRLGVAVCEPWPESGRATCADDAAAHFPGEPACMDLGPACPSGEWADGLPATGVIYVRAGGGTGGTGTRADPFGRIADALATASPGATVALSKGTFVEDVVVDADVTLVGACTRETTLRGATLNYLAGTIDVTAGAVTLRSLGIRGGDRPAITARGSATLAVEDVSLSGAKVAGLWLLDDAAATGSSLLVSDVGSDSAGNYGHAILLEGASTAELARVAIGAARDQGVRTAAGTTLSLDDAVVHDTLSRADGYGGRGVNILGDAQLARVVVEDNRDHGIIAVGAGVSVSLEDVIVRRTTAREVDGTFGRGLSVEEGAHVSGARVRLDENTDIGNQSWDGAETSLEDAFIVDTRRRPDGTQGVGAMAEQSSRLACTRCTIAFHRIAAVGALEGSELALTDVQIRDLTPLDSGAGGHGVEVGTRSTIRASRLAIDGAHEVAFIALGGVTLELEDLTITNTSQGAADPTAGAGLLVGDVASLLLTRAELRGGYYVSLFVDGRGTTATIRDLVVADTGEATWMGMPFGRGITIQSGAVATIERASLTNNQQIGLAVVSEDTSLTATDVVVRGTTADDRDLFGHGIGVTLGASFVGERLLVEHGREGAVLVDGPFSHAVLTNCVARNTQSRSSDGAMGVGVGAQRGGTAELTHAWIENNGHMGIFALSMGEIRGSDVTVSGTRPPDCSVAGTCPDRGIGVLSAEDSHVSLDGFTIDGNDVAGVLLTAGGTADLTHGVVRGHIVGASVDTEGFDIGRITTDVSYEDNETNLGSTSLPVPAPVDTTGSIGSL